MHIVRLVNSDGVELGQVAGPGVTVKKGDGDGAAVVTLRGKPLADLARRCRRKGHTLLVNDNGGAWRVAAPEVDAETAVGDATWEADE